MEGKLDGPTFTADDEPLIIYHGNCADGFTSAWIASHYFGHNCVLHAGVYGKPPPFKLMKADQDVYIVDFSYQEEDMRTIAGKCRRLTIIDHHETAQGRCQKLIDEGVCDGVFDMTKSGAGLTWEWFMAGPPSPFVEVIQDRDLWRFKLPHTRDAMAAIFSFPYDITVWDEISTLPMSELERMGRDINRKHDKDIIELADVVVRFMDIGTYEMAVANVPYTLTSDMAHLLASRNPVGIGACYWDTPGGRVFSLRSTQDGPNVAEIAASYGGGGHAHASGFTIPFNELEPKGLL